MCDRAAIQELLLKRVIEDWAGYRRVDSIWDAEETWTNESRSFTGHPKSSKIQSKRLYLTELLCGMLAEGRAPWSPAKYGRITLRAM